MPLTRPSDLQSRIMLSWNDICHRNDLAPVDRMAFDDVQGYIGNNSWVGYDRVYSKKDDRRNKKYVEEKENQMIN